MNIVYIIPGSGGSFYCGNCLRDNELFRAFKAEGHNVIKVPLYLPLFQHEEKTLAPVFFGAIALYLKQVFPVLRHLPSWFDRLLNARPLLRLAARQAGSTRARGHEDMTISMLKGEQGQQKEELEKMTEWLKEHFRADIVHISNALLLGLAKQLREELQVPVVCSLQDEDVWVDGMDEAFSDSTWALMAEKARDIDRFFAVSNTFAGFMQEKLQLPDAQLSRVHLGVDPNAYAFSNAVEKPRNIGFLSRLNHNNGLDILIDAFILLKNLPAHEDVGLLLTGGHTHDDAAFIRKQKKKLKEAGLDGAVSFIEDFEGEARQAFFNRIMLMSVPVRKGEAFGIYLAEAMAAGVPVVQPALGAFPEIIELSGGGITCPENTPAALANALQGLLNDREKLSEMSLNARKSVEERFNVHAQARQLVAHYREMIGKNRQQLPVNNKVLVRVKEVSRTFHNELGGVGREVLKGLDMEMLAGERVAIMGPSGSGKTTLLNIVGGLDAPDSGEVTVNGQRLSDMRPEEVTRYRQTKTGFVFQHHHLLPQCSLLENVLLPSIPLKKDPEAVRQRAEELLKYMGVWEQRNNKPAELSGGECQRAAVARALINEPELLLADEPTGSLDTKNAGQLMELLMKVSREMEVGLLVVTHAEQVARQMDRVMEIKDGRLLSR